jgi:hypothetical protein
MADYTIRASGGDYTTLSNWEATEQGDLSSIGTTRAEVYNDWASGLSDSVIISGWTNPSASNYVEIFASSNSGTQGASQHDGTPGSGALVKQSLGYDALIRALVDFTRITGLEVENTGSGSGAYALSLQADDSIIDKCICKGADTNQGTIVTGVYSRMLIKNTLVYESVEDGIVMGAWSSGKLLHCTVADCGGDGVILESNAGWEISHCVVYGSGEEDFDIDGTVSGGDYNTSEDGTQPNTANDFTLSGDPFVSRAGDDYRHGSGSELEDAGGTTGAGVSDDCIGTSRPENTDYDIGWFEYVSAGPSASPSISPSLSPSVSPSVSPSPSVKSLG